MVKGRSISTTRSALPATRHLAKELLDEALTHIGKGDGWQQVTKNGPGRCSGWGIYRKQKQFFASWWPALRRSTETRPSAFRRAEISLKSLRNSAIPKPKPSICVHTRWTTRSTNTPAQTLTVRCRRVVSVPAPMQGSRVPFIRHRAIVAGVYTAD